MLLNQASPTGGHESRTMAAALDWSDVADSEHAVEFYDTDDYLAESVAAYVGKALAAGETAIVIATAQHRNAIRRKLAARGLDLSLARAAGRYVALDAAATLAKFMDGDAPDEQRFNDVVGTLVARAAKHSRVRAFGEMVSLLWAEGNRDGAQRLEALWNELGKKLPFTLLCAYPMHGFGSDSDSEAFRALCDCHSRVVPSERYAALSTPDEQLRAVMLWQQRAQALEAEVARRKDAEHALVDFLENAPEAIHRVGADGTIVWANKAELALLGYDAHEYVGHHIAEFHVDADAIARILQNLQSGVELLDCEARLRHKDGSVRDVVINSNVLFRDGEFVHTRCFTRDITARKRAEEALREADRRKDEFLATLAHELRNPLAPLRTGLEVLRISDDGQEARRVHEILERQTGHLVRLVDDLLELSRVNCGTIELRKAPVDLAAAIRDAIENNRAAIADAGHRITLVDRGESFVVDADPVRLCQVFANLINNATKYTDRDGAITITLAREGAWAVVSIRDTGIGIPRNMLSRVFEPFTRLSSPQQHSPDGLGIGLTLARTLVALHGGTIEARSEGLQRGSEFVVRLPLADDDAGANRAPAADAAAPSIAPACRVLVVDDNHDAADSLAMLLRVLGADVRVVYDGQSALEAVRECRPSLLLLDIGMPGLDGYEVARQVRADPTTRGVTLAALTGWGQIEDRRRTREAGFDHHLVKPIDLTSLQFVLESSVSLPS